MSFSTCTVLTQWLFEKQVWIIGYVEVFLEEDSSMGEEFPFPALECFIPIKADDIKIHIEHLLYIFLQFTKLLVPLWLPHSLAL